MQELIEDLIETLKWMIADFDWRKEQTDISVEDSPELIKAKGLLAKLEKLKILHFNKGL